MRLDGMKMVTIHKEQDRHSWFGHKICDNYAAAIDMDQMMCLMVDRYY
jgi:hypothetical protein